MAGHCTELRKNKRRWIEALFPKYGRERWPAPPDIMDARQALAILETSNRLDIPTVREMLDALGLAGKPVPAPDVIENNFARWSCRRLREYVSQFRPVETAKD